MASQPKELVSLANRSTGVDRTSGFVTRNAEGQLGVFSLSLHSKQPKRTMITSITAISRPPIIHVPTMRPSCGRTTGTRGGSRWRGGLRADDEIADLEAAVAGDADKLKLLN